MIAPRDFIDRWAKSDLREQQAAQSHFNELCQLVGHKTPTQLDPEGKFFTFEENVTKATGGRGRADVWYNGRFAWEYKGKHKDLDAAYAQLLAYRGDLGNPPLLVVCDFLEYRIYPQWPNTSGQPFVFRNEELDRPDTLRFITWLLEDPEQFLQLRQSELAAREQITLGLAYQFAHLADLMRDHAAGEGWTPFQIARFLTKLVFTLFTEDVGLLPTIGKSQSALRFIIEGAKREPESFVDLTRDLFAAMNGDRRLFITYPVPYFNGGLFADSTPGSGDGLEVLDLTHIPGAINLLEEASERDWRKVNPTIFGTLFEGALDVSKRAQLGAHYTGEADIRLVIEPVLMEPLYREWEAMQVTAAPLLQTLGNPAAAPRPLAEARDQLTALHDQMMNRLGSCRILDPACGSGNFLYVSLRALKDLESKVRKFFEPLGLPFRDVVTPRQLYGIEKDEFAARLAHVVVWIGYLQWRYEDEGVLHPYLKATSSPHPRQLPNPIIQDKAAPDEPDRIQNADAILRYDAAGKPVEPDWPEVDVIVGNPPFLGGHKFWSELGREYSDNLFSIYDDRVPASADLVCYWFEKARHQLEISQVKRVGLLATNSIRGGANRKVLDRIDETGQIFLAWPDREWVLQGAAVRISIIGFDDGNGTETIRILDGNPVSIIHPDLTADVNTSQALQLSENDGLCYRGNEKQGKFDITAEAAAEILKAANKSGLSNADVIKPYINGLDVVRRLRNMWIIDFVDRSLEEAEKYQLPIQYVRKHVKPERDKNNRAHRRERWWQHGEIMPNMRAGIAAIDRYICTPRVSKHRVFAWLNSKLVPDNALVIFLRADDYFFGALHSYAHECWSLRKGTFLGVGNDPRYTPTTTFETFPFPWSPGKEDTASPYHAAISAAAAQLHTEREAWLNPPDLIALGADSKALKERTLTNLYNAVVALREGKNGNGKEKLVKAARDFAPRLIALHDALDAAVLAAYGWSDLVGRLRSAEGDEELLRRLLALNAARSSP